MSSTAIAPLPGHQYFKAAKAAYTTWAHAMGLSAGFEQLPNREYTAWHQLVQELIEGTEDDFSGEPATCGACERELRCPKCEGPECRDCGDALTCAECDATERRARALARRAKTEPSPESTRPPESARCSAEAPPPPVVSKKGDAHA